MRKSGSKLVDASLPRPEILHVVDLVARESPSEGKAAPKELVKLAASLKTRKVHLLTGLPDSEVMILKDIAEIVSFDKGDLVQLENNMAIYIHVAIPSKKFDFPAFVLTQGVGNEARVIEAYASDRACFGVSEFLLRDSLLDRKIHGVVAKRYRSSAICFRGGSMLRFKVDKLAENLGDLPHFSRNLGAVVAEKLFRRRTLWDKPSPLTSRMDIALWHIVFAATEIVPLRDVPEGTRFRKNSQRMHFVRFPSDWVEVERRGSEVIGIPISLRSFAKCVDSDNVSVGRILKEIEAHTDESSIKLKKLVPHLWRNVKGYEEGVVYVSKKWAIRAAQRSPSALLGRSAF